MNVILRLLVNAAALWAAAALIQGIGYTGEWPGMVGLALIFGIVNTYIKPVLNFLSFPVQVLTVGLFSIVINAFLLMLTGWLASLFGIPFTVDGFIPALFGAIVVSIVSGLLNIMLEND